MLKRLLQHPLTRDCDIDDPATTALRRRIIRDKVFLRRLYEEWYARVAAALPPADADPVLEIGSGAGFMKDAVAGVLASEVFAVPGVDLVLSGYRLPFPPASLRGVAMTDVLHHIPDPAAFFGEAARCVRPGGRLVMIEPWVTTWSRWVYRYLHHEPFLPDAAEWRLPPAGPLSGANGAMPWMILSRDRQRFINEFPEWRVDKIEPMMPFAYLASGGVGWRSLLPGFAYAPVRAAEALLQPWIGHWAMFALVVLERVPNPPSAKADAT